jgi:hypothetical protein
MSTQSMPIDHAQALEASCDTHEPTPLYSKEMPFQKLDQAVAHWTAARGIKRLKP